MNSSPRELIKEEYDATLSPPMRDVTQSAEEVVDLWSYADIVIKDVYHNCSAWDWHVKHIYESQDGSYQHINIPVPKDNTYLVVITDKKNKIIVGHYFLDLGALYLSSIQNGDSVIEETRMFSIPEKRIFIEQLEEMFENIANESGWDMSRPMLWGHFFTHSEPSRLDSAIEKLEKLGLRYVDLYQSEKDNEDDLDVYWLHMEEVRIHTPASLDVRNDEFYLFAQREGIDTYDGMDVGFPQ